MKVSTRLLLALGLLLFAVPWILLLRNSWTEDSTWGIEKLGAIGVQERLAKNARLLESAFYRYTSLKQATPDSLDDLVHAGVLKRIPVNPFSGLPVQIIEPNANEIEGNISYRSIPITHVEQGGAVSIRPGFSVIFWGDGRLVSNYPSPREKFLKETSLYANADKIFWIAGDVQQISGKYGDGSVDVYQTWQEAWPLDEEASPPIE